MCGPFSLWPTPNRTLGYLEKRAATGAQSGACRYALAAASLPVIAAVLDLELIAARAILASIVHPCPDGPALSRAQGLCWLRAKQIPRFDPVTTRTVRPIFMK